MDVIHQIVGTALLRPYFVGFLLAYLFACSLHLASCAPFFMRVADTFSPGSPNIRLSILVYLTAFITI